VSKATIIRKKALDLVRDQEWTAAIREYKRLVELDQNNPNVYNELADLYLKTNQKVEAYDAFIQAVDEYTRVGLHNNAVAVCKKVLRVLPGRVEVFTKLGLIRSRQGLKKEAESYYLQFLEKAAAGAFEPAEFAKHAGPIAAEMKDSPGVLQRLAEALAGYNLSEDAGRVLIALYQLNSRNGDAGGVEATRAVIERLGLTAVVDAALTHTGPRPSGNGTVITEENIWTQAHSDGDRIEIESTPRFTPPSGKPSDAPASQPADAPPAGPSERDLYLLRLARGSADPRPSPAAAAPPAPAASPAATQEPAPPPAPPEEPEAASAPDPVEDEPVVAAAAPGPKAGGRPSPPAGADRDSGGVQISAMIADEVGEESGEADYRSHYDLGMAYLEMDLLAEAIREYQMAARSPQYQVKCLEMIGLCFIKQNEPKLAIRQLSKGLGLIGSDGDDSLGIKYNLGLAHEMIGDVANARTYFEDVYVVDVTFRDVTEKIRKLAKPS
jgi:tetratricopeptide (TPR) repeat protein